jgi:gliding motility-associated-like protein
MQNPYHCYNTAGNFNIGLTYGTAQGCKKTITGNNLITVFNSPEADFTANNFSTDILNPTINFTNQSQGAIAYSWSYGDGDLSNITNPSHIYSSVGDFAVSLIAINTLGCTDTATHIVYIKEMYTFYAPSCFTPNGDYLNEHFLPEGTGWDNATFSMQIFDRWGNHVFTSKDYSKGWDGKKSASQDIVQEDVYVWKVSLNDNNGKQHEYHGIVSLIK